jgi:hypothetical protein
MRFGEPSGTATAVVEERLQAPPRPLLAISFAVASSSSWPWSMHFTPASIACRTARGV